MLECGRVVVIGVKLLGGLNGSCSSGLVGSGTAHQPSRRKGRGRLVVMVVGMVFEGLTGGCAGLVVFEVPGVGYRVVVVRGMVSVGQEG